MAESPQTARSTYRCTECDFTCKGLEKLWAHANREHPGSVRKVLAPWELEVGMRVRAGYPNTWWGEGVVVDYDPERRGINPDTGRRSRQKPIKVRRDSDGRIGWFFLGDVEVIADEPEAAPEPTVRRYMDVRFDITDLTEDEAAALAGEVQAQAEASDYDQDGTGGHPGVEVEARVERGRARPGGVVTASPIRRVVWKDEGDFGFITTLTQADLDHRAANPTGLGVPYDPDRIRAHGSIRDAEALAREHDAELVIS